MSDTNGSGEADNERAPAGATVREEPPRAVADDSRDESERIKRRLGAAIVIPLASVVVLAVFVVAVSTVLLEVEHFGALAAPLVAGLVAGVILVIAWRGWLSHDPRMSFARLLVGIVAIGVVLLGGTVWLLRSDSGAGPDLPEGTIAVLALEYELVAESWSAPEGEITFNYESGGQVGHTLTIEGREGELLLKVTPASPMDTGSIHLDEGIYTVYCDLQGHRELGMEATLEVTHRPPPGPPPEGDRDDH